MKLNETELWIVCQIRNTAPNIVLNEIYMTWRLSRDQAVGDTAESIGS